MKTSPDQDASTLTLRCRLIPDFNVFVAIGSVFALLLLGLAITKPLDPSEITAFILGLPLTLTAPLYWLVARIRGAIILDKNGVRWRTAFSGWKSANWDEVESCDLRLTSTKPKFVVSTRTSTFSWTECFQNSDQFAPFAARFCSLIPAETANWPRYFGADTFENRVMPWMVLPVTGGYSLFVVWKLFSSPPSYWVKQISYVREISGWPLAIFALVAGLTLMVVFPALILLVFWDTWKRNFPRRREFFIASPDGVTYHRTPNPPLFVPWSELQHLHAETRYGAPGFAQHRFETSRGELLWNSALQGWEEFDRLLHAHAPELPRTVARSLRMSFSDAPDPAAETQIFDFKTRELRAMLILPGFLSLTSLAFAIFGPPPGKGEPLPQWTFFVWFILLGAMTIYGSLLYRSGQIRLDARGITWKLPHKTRFAAWGEISEFQFSEKPFLRVGTAKWSFAEPFPPGHLALLAKEIQRRVAQSSLALGSDISSLKR